MQTKITVGSLLKWKTDNIRVLGTDIGNNMRQNWETPTHKTESTLQSWKARTLTVKGRAVILKTYAIVTIVYLASMFIIPEQYITRIHMACFKFLWNDKNELVSRETCHLPSRHGGLGIPDLHITRTLAIIKWIKQLINRKKSSTWLFYGRYWTGQALGCVKPEWQWLQSNLTPHGNPGKTPRWYKELIKFVSENRQKLKARDDNALTSTTLKSMLQVLSQPRCLAIWQRSFHPRTDIAWLKIWKGYSSNTVKEFLWKLTYCVTSNKRLSPKVGHDS